MSADVAADLYDHDVQAIMVVHMALRERYQGLRRNWDSFESEARQRFAEAGFTVDITWYEYSLAGQKQDGGMPEITVTGKIESKEFDHDRQVHEVTSGLLGIPGEEGVIKTDKETLRRFLGDQDHGHAH